MEVLEARARIHSVPNSIVFIQLNECDGLLLTTLLLHTFSPHRLYHKISKSTSISYR